MMDEERLSMLATLITGLEALAFAVETDTYELNRVCTTRPVVFPPTTAFVSVCLLCFTSCAPMR